MIDTSYQEFKDFVTANNYQRKVKSLMEGSYRVLFVNIEGLNVQTKVHETEAENILDYETNLAPHVNKESAYVEKLPFDSKLLPDGTKLYRRKHGIISSCLAGQEKDIDFIVPYPHCKINKVEIIEANKLDVIDLSVHDDAAGSYSTVPNLMLNQFGFDVVITDYIYSDKSNYDADLYYGMVIKIKYKNKGTVDANFGINIILHEVK